MLKLEKLYKTFGAIQATRNVSLTIEPNTIHALIGPNGAGKSTLISLVSGELRPDSGSIHLDGEALTGKGVADRARRGLGRSFQISQLLMGFSVIENVMIALLAAEGVERQFWRNAFSDPHTRDRAMDLLARVHLDTRAFAPLPSVSHGERRQIELAMVMARRARVLLLDEPMAGLGHQEAARMVRTIAQLKSDSAILLVEHDMDAVFQLADDLSVLVYGEIVSSGDVEAIRNDPLVRKAYLGDAV